MAKGFQYGFSADHHDAMHDREHRTRKAETMRRVLEDALGPLTELRVLDLGTSTGIIGAHLANSCKQVVGLDIDLPAVTHASGHHNQSNLAFTLGDGMQMPFADNTFNVVICAQIYEHVPDASRLLADIHRVLKPGGVCYFAAGNRLMLMEPHYRLPLLSVMPKLLAHLYLRLAGRGNHYYETHYTYWGLKRLVERFDVIDYTARVIADPDGFGCAYMVAPGSRKQRIALQLIQHAYWLVPGYIWLLRKPATR